VAGLAGSAPLTDHAVGSIAIRPDDVRPVTKKR